ncbi:MAG TPA: hypothetical protein VML75_20940 [Kofleriaceae bacterium]|nr:hypothetical protein [Kofleriaceae bacterium]
MKISLIALALSFSLACGSSAPPAAEPAPAPAPADPVATEPAPVADPVATADSPSVEELGKAAMVMMEAMAKAAADHKGDCDAQADALQVIVDDNAALVTEMNKADKDPAKKQYFEETHAEEAMKIMGGMMEDLADCQDNEKLQKVFESLG